MANKVVTFLDHLGNAILTGLKKATGVISTVGQEIEPEVDDIAALAGAAGIGNIFNSVVSLAGAAQATANGIQGTGTQKLALVVAGLTPQFEAWLAQNNVKMNTGEINSWVNDAVNLIMKIPAPATTPATNTATPAATPAKTS